MDDNWDSSSNDDDSFNYNIKRRKVKNVKEVIDKKEETKEEKNEEKKEENVDKEEKNSKDNSEEK